MNQKIVDTHHHLWSVTENSYPWLSNDIRTFWFGDYSSIRKNYLVEDYLQDCKNQNIVKSVHLQAAWDPTDPVGESKWLQECHEKYGYPNTIVAYAYLADPNVESTLRHHCAYPNVKGIRMDLNWHNDPSYRQVDRPNYMVNENWLRGLSLLEKYNLSFDLQIYCHQIPEAAKLLEKFPRIQFILTHAGMPIDRSRRGFNLWSEHMERLAYMQNISVKISGFGMFDMGWNLENVKPFILRTIELFGIDRCMFASNFPVEKLFCSFDSIFNSYKETLKDFSQRNKDKIFYENAIHFYKL